MLMEPGRWVRITDIYHATIARPPVERASFLGEECHGDDNLRKQVEAMVKSHERSGNFIESPAFAVAPELLIDEPAGDLIGQSIGHYRIESLLGVGGMGEVYLARDELLGRKVALKFLPEHLTAEATQLSRFKSEARTASALNHPNILTVHEIDVEGKRQFIATEFIEGITLRALLARGRMNLHDALEIAVQVASALAAAHETGVVHRDIKPENIMLRPDGYAKVLDFGIAKLTEQQPASDLHEVVTTTTLQTQPGLVLGTARYMSPEQTRGQKADVRSDIWSLGVVVYEMVGGVPPFSGETPSDCIASILTTEPPLLSVVSPNVPRKLQAIVQKALRKNRDERYQTIKEMLADLRRLKEVSESITSGWKRQKKITALLAASVAVALVIAGLFIYMRPTRTVTNTLVGNASPLVSVIPEKSVAVLPFKNLSADQESARFADGMQDEILTDLARIADLKVISRTSVMQYESGIARNLREIGQQLGVAHLLEGSVQRAANRVRVNAKLIDARTDAHLWAQTYDRDLADVFAIQSEIAEAIADQLQARLSPNEKAAIENPPTADLAAFDLYSRAKTLLVTTSFTPTGEQNLRQAVELLNQAATRDSAFFEAYYQLAFVHGRLYSLGFDHTASRLASAEAALQAAIRLRPDAGETHLARANYLYYGPRDYAGALAELETGRRSLPNDPRLSELTGYILRRRGQQEEGLRNLEKAMELDPRNSFIMQQIALSYQFLRRYPEEAAILDRALTIIPKDAATKVNRTLVDFYWKADTKPLHHAIDSILAGDPGAISEVADSWFVCALAEHDRVAAERALVALGDNPWLVDAAVILSRSFGEGLLARVMKDEAKARAAFSKARAEQEKIVQAQPNYGPALCVLGLIDSALGRKEAALQEARRATELLPVEKDSINGSHMIQYFAITAAWTGEKDLALQQLELGARAPTPSQALNYGALKLLPFWDPLRGDSRFEKIVASLGPKEAKRLSESHTSPSQAPAQSPTEKSIAVLPFADLTQTRDQEYFCDGIQEEILTRLSKIADLKVISRTSTQRYKNSPSNLLEIAKELGVAHILEGTIQKSADQVRVNVQLINAQNDSHLWADKYDRKLTDIFSIESEIAEKIADSLQAKLSSAEQMALNAHPTESTEAHQLYLRGRYVMEKRTPADLNKAANYFNQAITQDPHYAAAYAGLADCYVLLPQWKQGPVAEYLSKARAAANKALQIDGNLADAHASLGMIAFGEKLDLREAKREFERAIQLNPNYALAHYCLGYSVLLALGNHDQAVAELKQAIELDPVSSVINTNLGSAYILARRYPEAIAQLRKTIELNPGFAYAHAILGEALELNGQLDDAFTEYEKSYNAGHDFRGLMMMARVHGLKGDRAKALQMFEQAKQLNSPDIWAFGCAMVYLGLGDRNEALNWLEQSYQQKEFINVSTIKDDPLFDPLHGDPRFEKLVNQIMSPAVIAAGATSIPTKSIAVLPFKPLLAASRDESLEIGMADTLITKLGNLRQIIVRPVSAVRKYAGLEQDPVAAGREQRADAVLDGTIQKSGERIRVTVRLLSAADGQQLWADKFEDEFTDIFSVEDSISERVAAALAGTLTGADKKQLTKRYTENAEAYQLYLKGRYYAARYTPEGTKKAIAYFDKAIALDPNYALAYDGLAYCYYASDWFGPPKENFAKGRALVEKALEIDPALAEAHVSLGLLVAWLDYDWPGAEREFKRAFELNANYPPAHLWYGYYLMGLGNFDQSIAEIKRAIELDPLSAEANIWLGIALLDGHRYDEALQQLRTTVEAEPDNWLAHLYFARALEKKGELSGAIAELKKTTLIEGAPAEVVSALGYAYAVSGNKAEAEKIILQLKEQSEQSKQFYVPAYGIATIYAGLGDKERAFAYLEKEYANGAFYLNYLKVDPEVDNLRSDPRFADLLRRVRLAP